ncbi:MAG: pilus assembly protein [Anaerolineales bacterium]|nr:pilus assembly protein [Anaerolineales bacterium]
MNRLPIRIKRKNAEGGQALVEFALILIVLLLLVFFIVEAGRILWGWAMVQNAARRASRYAITGNFEPDLACLQAIPATCATDEARVISIHQVALDAMTGLPTDETIPFDEDFYLLIEVWGVNEFGEFENDFAGIPGQPMMVRVVYNVPIITPILSGIVENVPVLGQVVINNELFNQVGGISSGQSLPPIVPPVPTAGPTATPTPTDTPTTTATFTPGPSPTNTPTSTLTPSATPIRCAVRFNEISQIVDGANSFDVTGDFNSGNDFLGTPYNLTVIDLTTGTTLASGIPMVNGGGNFDCPGFRNVILPGGQTLQANHIIIVQSEDGTFDVATVATVVPTATLIPTDTPEPTFTYTPTPSTTPSATPVTPYIVLDPTCAIGPNPTFRVRGFNWPTSNQVTLFWDGAVQDIIPAGHSGSFIRTWNMTSIANGFYTVRANNGTTNYTVQMQISNNCGFVTSTPIPATPTNTPNPADLVIVGDPVMQITRPLAEHTPVVVRVVISNTGEVDINSQFFVDVYFDPDPADLNLPTSINVNSSSGYMAVSSLAGRTSRVITITAPLGFTGGLTVTREVYAMVDSLRNIDEDPAGGEDNNIAGPIYVANVTPGPTPTATSVFTSGLRISGVVRTLLGNWVPQHRAAVYLFYVDGPSGTMTMTNQTTSAQNGTYLFDNLLAPDLNDYYQVVGCITFDSIDVFTGYRTAIVPTNDFVDIFMLPELAGCPVGP